MSRAKAAILLLSGILVIVGMASLLVFLEERGDRIVRDHMDEAEAALAEGDLLVAEAALEAVLEREPEHIEAAQQLFDTVAYFNPARGRELLEVLRSAGADPEALAYRAVGMALAENDLEAAEAAVAGLEALKPLGREGQLARLRVLLAEGDFEAAAPLFEAVLDAYSGDRQARFISGQIFAAEEDLLLRIRAKDTLMRLLDKPDEVSFKSAVFLFGARRLPLFGADLRAAADHLAEHPHLEEGIARLEAPLVRGLVSELAGVRPELAFEISRLLVKRPGATPGDALLRVYSGQEAGKTATVKEAAETLLEQQEWGTDGIAILSRQLILEDRHAEALYLIAEALAAEPESEVLLRVLLWQLMTQSDGMDKAEALRLADAIRAHPKTDPRSYLMAANAILNREPGRSEAVYAAAEARLGGDHLIRLCRWLLERGQPERVLALIPERAALRDLDRMSVHFEALLALGRFDDARDLLSVARALLAGWQYDFLLAQVRLQAGDPAGCRELLAGLLDDPPPAARSALFGMAAMAAGSEAPELERAAYELAHATGQVFPMEHAMAYLGKLLGDGNLEESLRFSAYCRNLYPENPFFINNNSYLKAISGREIEDCIADMRAVVERFPDVHYFRLTLALSELIGGYPGRALETLGKLDASVELVEPRTKLAWAVVLAGNGEQQKASPVLDEIDVESLMQPEQDLVSRYFLDGRF